MDPKKATLTGLVAILMWSAMVGLIKNVSEAFGAIGGAALIYTASSAILIIIAGFPVIRQFPRRYLVIGSILFVSYEICLSLSLGFTHSGRQAIEVGMVNYLWPGMTILLSVLITRQKVSLLIIPGVIVSIFGICRVLGGEAGLSLSNMSDNIMDNPLSYGLAFSGAVIWAIYCVVTKEIAKGHNGITLFFILTALTLWIKFLFSPPADFVISLPSWISLALAAMVMGFGYAAWNIGILHGNVTILAAASYFIPILSAILAALMLNSPLSAAFWQGAAMVSLGSLICWWSTRASGSRQRKAETSQ